ncbi:hypothetical protein TVAG_100610 [Trichomonas vaginalis G3]|uniref:Transmembrane protein n=1 Tax=Trichomonas vaginalis (strain ATCC PRA-98 / G3) TaxID=412133 RepID=A2ENN8_TRIV3|nr:cytochrome B561, N terminal-containing protein [Trichomonas vaginalis G3]EAY05738.1 hypothetical protein TVAG_100610 [Trichomonas vaginalis G3]KAI5535154.1 cytochrome B561, N terminal-containing protein [Trichomonas vaginalis G3]|eukprot:XP_001317961.1 hypothetical protein [Trichomonas vaginalis G3]
MTESKLASLSPTFQLQQDSYSTLPLTRYEDIQLRINKPAATDSKENDNLSKIFSSQNIYKSQTNTKQAITPTQINSRHQYFKKIHSPNQKRAMYIIVCAATFVVFLFLFFINVFPDFTLFVSLISFILTVIGIIAFSRHDQKTKMPIHTYSLNAALPKTEFAIPSSPSSIFAKEPTYNSNLPNIQAPTNIYRPYIISDRPKSSLQHSQFRLDQDTSIDQLAGNTLNILGLSSVKFNKYLVNMKAFIQKSVLQKLSSKLGLSDNVVEAMVSIPNYEHCSQYVLHRINTLASAAYLAGHFGDRGDRWNEREWTNELPSDNQIILHIISVWISSLIGGIKNTKRLQFIFKQRYVYIGENPVTDTDDDIMLCSDDWSNFYVLCKYKTQNVERFYALPGRDSMYAALTIFFFIVKEKHKFFLEGCDFTGSPFFMDKVYSAARFE